jgi:hypothetical protein
MKRLVLAAMILFFPQSALNAQSLTPEEIRAQIDAERAAPNPYADLLADPEPFVAVRAMEIMIESGDAELLQLAVEFGVNSPQPEVRHRALGAWLASNPRIEFLIENAGSPVQQYASLMESLYDVAPNSRGQAIWIVTIAGFSETEECFTFNSGRQCLFRHTPNGTWIRKNETWQEIGLNDAGELVGTVVAGIGGVRATVRLSAPVP